MPAWPSSIRVRLTLWYAILLGLPLAVFAVISYVAFSRALVSGTNRFIGEALGAFIRLAGADQGAPIVGFTTASSSAAASAKAWREDFATAGVSNVEIPIVTARDQADDTGIANLVSRASGIFLGRG